MPLGTEALQIFYEISMSIGSDLDTRSMLKTCLGKYLRKLNLSAGCLLQKSSGSEGAAILEPLYLLPKLEGVNRAKQICDQHLAPRYSKRDFIALEKSLPLCINAGENEFAYIFSLPDLGLLALVKNGTPFTEQTVRSLAPLNAKLSNALRACLQKDELERSEKSLEKANRRLKEWDTDKLAFIQYISHELNTPLNWIGSLHMVELDVLSEDNRRCVEFASKGFRRISKLTKLASDYFEKARVNWPGERREIYLEDLKRALADLYRPLAESKGVRLDFSGTWEGSIFVDEKGLKGVLTTLCSNAIGFSDFQGCVTVSAFPKEQGIEFVIEDEGVGIEPELLESIFKPCQIPEHKRTPGGYGFSLPRARIVSQSNNWSLRATSEGPGKGATFKLRI
ncbi:sensor histidine kinase [Pelagicoccus albus]|uniref:histidine kinase n=1 Tax=Pelagicoccus albus TaxID=415222 RepID=A0A7X1E6C4_9BACT|nr:HAMP domain-containing sensor histidine kinase [Pelagicoccus albus]MBC2604535.1 HAMP domain-containing histidine kinase [Pelagicoccus albus]